MNPEADSALTQDAAGDTQPITVLQMLTPYLVGLVMFLVLFIVIPWMWRRHIIKSDLPTSIPDCPPEQSKPHTTRPTPGHGP